MAAAGNLLLIAAVAAVSLIAASDARPCGHAQTLLISFSSVSRPNPDPTNPAPLTTTVVTVLRVRRLGPHQIRRHEALPAAAAASEVSSSSSSSVQDRAKDILVVVSGLLFGFGCGALTAASMYLPALRRARDDGRKRVTIFFSLETDTAEGSYRVSGAQDRRAAEWLTAAEFVVRPLLNEILDNYCSAESISESTLCDV